MHKHIPAIPAELSLGGVVKTATLRQHGYTQQEIRKAVDSNTLIRVREGWYAAQGADQRVVQAVSRGGILGCASAIAFHGGWALKDGKTHTYCAQRGRQKTSPRRRHRLARRTRARSAVRPRNIAGPIRPEFFPSPMRLCSRRSASTPTTSWSSLSR